MSSLGIMDSGNLDDLEDALDDLLGGDFLGLGLVAQDEPMTKHVGPDRLDVFGRHVSAMAQKSVRTGCQGKCDRRARAGAVLDESGELFHAASFRLAAREDDFDD